MPVMAAGAPALDRFGLPIPTGGVATLPPPPVDMVMAAEVEPGGRMLSGKAVALVAICIGVGIVGAVVSWALAQDKGLEPESYLRYAIVITLGVYAVVGTLIVTRLVPGIRLRWHTGAPATSILIGGAIGATLGFALLGLVSAAHGHLTSDPRIVLLMSEGDVPHLLVAAAIGCVCAPLVEETLFRGVFLESLRARRSPSAVSTALFASAGAFAVWHLNIAIAPLIYYGVMGLIFGGLYLRRGLVASMAGHFAFNGVLTVAALAIVLAPTKTVTFGSVSLDEPGGWERVTAPLDGDVLRGPSGAELLVGEIPTMRTLTSAVLMQRLRSGAFSADVPGVDIDITTLRQTQLPAGSAAQVDVHAQGHAGTLVLIPQPNEVVMVVFLSGGSPKAQADFPRMLDSVRVG